MLKTSDASANIVTAAGHRSGSMKSFHFHHTRKVPKGPEGLRSTSGQGNNGIPRVLPSKG